MTMCSVHKMGALALLLFDRVLTRNFKTCIRDTLLGIIWRPRMKNMRTDIRIWWVIMVLRNACRTDSYVRIWDTLFTFQAYKNGLINCFNVSLRLIVFEQYFVYHSICPNCLRFLRSKAEFFVPSMLVAALFRKSGMLDRSKWRMTLFICRNLPQEITVMIINTGQMCTVNYSGRNVRFKGPRLDKKNVL